MADSAKDIPAGDDKPDEAPALPERKFSRVSLSMGSWMAALGVTAICAAVGFIGKVSLQQFLGIDLGNWTASDLSLFAGHWAFDTLSVVLNEVFLHPFAFGIPFVVYLSVLFLPYLIPSVKRYLRLATMISVFVLVGGVATVLARYEVPTLGMQDWLTNPLADQLAPTQGLLNEWRSDLQASLLISKTRDIPDLDQRVCETVIPADRNVFLSHYKGNKLPPADYAAERLNRIYVWTILLCIASWIALGLHAAVDAPAMLNVFLRRLLLLTGLSLLPIATVLLPNMYAKLIYKTYFPRISIAYKDAKQEPAEATDPNRLFLMMDETDKDLSLFMIPPRGDAPFVQVLNRDEITKMTRYDNRDVLASIIQVQCTPPAH